MLRIACAFILTMTLIGCGGSGGGSSETGIDPRLERLAVYEAQNLRVLGVGAEGMGITEAIDVPDSGMLSLRGNTTIRVEDGGNPMALFGDAEIAFDFETGTGQGRLHRFFGNDASGSIVDFAGEIVVSSSTAQQDLALGYQGTLTSTSDALTFDGTMQGVFLGTPIAGFVGIDLEAGIDHNGRDLDGSVVMITMIDDPP